MTSTELAGVLRSVAEEIAGTEYKTQVDYDRRKSRVISMVLDDREGAMQREMQTGELARRVSSKESPWQR